MRHDVSIHKVSQIKIMKKERCANHLEVRKNNMEQARIENFIQTQ